MRLWRRAVVAGVRVKQAFLFMSPEWDEFHDHTRQSIESLHSGFAESEPDRVRADAIVRRRDRVWDNAYTKTTARDSILHIAARGELESPLRT